MYQVNILNLFDSYKEMTWLFSSQFGHESTNYMHTYVDYIIYYVRLHNKEIFGAEELVSNEISHQLREFEKTQRFYIA